MSGAVKGKDYAVDGNAASNATAPSDPAKVDQHQEDQLNARLQQNEDAGARVMDFDENATPEEKAAKAKGLMPKGVPHLRKNKANGNGSSMASDIDGKAMPTTVGMADVDEASKFEGQMGSDGPNAPGAIAAGGTTSTLPDWYEVGWTGVAKGMRGFTGQAKDDDEAVRQDLMAQFLGDAYYGYFWWNGAVIIVAILATYFATRFGGGWGTLIIIGAFCSTYYNASMRRTRQRARDDITREMAKKRMMSEHETADWINHFLSRFWLIYEPVLSATIIATVDSTLATQTPAFLDSIRMTTFTLGTKAPRIDHVRTFPATEDDIVMMDWQFSFTPNDALDLTVRQAANKINPKIVLTVRVGRGVVGAGMPILLEDISFVGNIRLRMKLMSNFPHVQLVDISFMEPPKFDYVLKPIGGNTFGFDIGNIPGLSVFIQEQVHANLGPMMYNPNMFTINLEQLLSGTPLDTAIGVLQITIFSARNLKGVKFGGGTPDPYVAISLNGRETLAKTKYKHSTDNPQFKETKFILLNNLNDMLSLALMDFNDHRPDSHLGAASFELKSLEEDPEQENLSTPVMLDGKERGQVQYSLSYYPVIKPTVAEDGKVEPLPETRSGVVRLTIHQAKELDKRSGFIGELNPKARVLLNGNNVYSTAMLKRTNNPIWETSTEFLVTERKKAVVGVEIIDDRDLSRDPVVAYLSVKLDDLLHAKEKQQDWFPLTGTQRGRLRMSADWKPVLMSGSMNGGSGYSPAIGVVKFWMKKGIDLKNVEAMMGGKSDPYVQLKLRGQVMDGSVIVNNDLNPEWNEILYCPVHSLRETITIEVMDYQNVTKDRSLGTVEVKVSDLARKGEDEKLGYESVGKKSMRDRVNLGRGVYKGEIVYDCEFLPGVQLKGVEFQGAGNEVANKAMDGTADGDVAEDSGTQDPESEEAAQRHSRMAKPTVAATTDGGFKEKGVHHANPHKKGESIASMASIETAATAETSGTVPEAATGGVTMSRDELLATQSGVLVFNILSGQLARKNARLEVLFDDAYWPAYTTEKGRTQHCTWDEVGETTIKELDWSRIWLKLRTGDDDEEVFAEFQGNTKDFLERTLDKPGEFKLASDAGTYNSTVTVSCKYIPVDVHLETIESVNNQGFLRIDLLDAKNLRAADRGGKSDPYVVFNVNGERVFKSKVVKRTLNPEWNENLGECQISSRVGADAVFEVFDWDQVGTPDKLGQAAVNLADLEPFQATERTLQLSGKGALEKSTVRVRLVFRPEFVASRGRKGTSLTFGAAGRTFTQGVGGIGRVGVGAGKGVVHGAGFVGKGAFGVGRGALGVIRGGRHGQDASGGVISEEGEVVSPEAVAAANGMPASASGLAADGREATPEPGAAGMLAPGVPGVGGAGIGSDGNLVITVVEAKELAHDGEHDVYAELNLGKHTIGKTKRQKSVSPQFGDHFTVKTTKEPMVIKLAVLLHKTFGSDKEIGEADVDIWQYILPAAAQTTNDFWASLGASGGVRLRLEWVPGPPAPASPSQEKAGSVHTASDSPRRSRLSFHGRRA